MAAIAGLILCATACTGSNGEDAAEPSSPEDEQVDDSDWTAAQGDYLAFAAEELDPTSALSILAAVEHSRRDPEFDLDLSEVTVDSFAEDFRRIDTWQDTTDFTILYWMNLLLAAEDGLPEDLVVAMDERLLAYSYWYTEPVPEGVVDEKWYWSENHRIIFHTLQYLAGLRHPDEVFQDGRTGTVKAEEAREWILEWLDEHATYGFSEWHSDVYYQKDVTPLLTLVEHAPDPEVARRAEIMLDLVLLDIAVHLQNGNFGASHGRSYMKDKPVAWTQDTFNLSKLLFDDTEVDYTGTDAGATLLARAQRYVMPDAIRAVAKDPGPMLDRTRMGVPFDADAEWEPDPVAPDGRDFDDPENLAFWWERGALTAWQVAPMTLRHIEANGLWEAELFSDFSDFRIIAGAPDEQIEQLAATLSLQVALGVLQEMNSTTWRGEHAMLSSVQDYRPGRRGNQYHAWQATLDEGAVVFTTHPGNEPREGDRFVDGDMYWTGTASMPRTAQHGTATIHIYDPGYENPPPGDLLEAFGYLEETHAWFPTERFDEVVEEDGWTFGRSGDGYVALWSWRDTQWRQHDPEVVPTGGLTGNHDLVAPGGAENVWLVQVGELGPESSDGTDGQYPSFDGFREAVTGSTVGVEQAEAGFEVSWSDTSEGDLSFSWSGPLEVDGDEVAISGYPRMANEYVSTDGPTWSVNAGGSSLILDTENWSREIG
jgi:hypothetical protein